MRYSPVSPPQDLFLPYQQKDRQQSFVSRLLPIVFDDKALSGVFTLIILPAYLSPPLPKRECCGLPTVNRYHGTLTPPRIAPSRPSQERRKYHYTLHLHRRKQPHHTTVIALRWSLTPFREVLASEAVLLRSRGKIRSTDYSVFKEQARRSD